MNSEEFEKFSSKLDKYEELFLKNDEEIERIIDFWHNKSDNSAMYVNHPKYIMFKTPIRTEALKHCKIVELFDYIAQIDKRYFLEWTEYQKQYKENTSYDAPRDKYVRLNQRYISYMKKSKEIIDSLEITHDFDTLYYDFYNERVIIKLIFKKVFSKYGIDLDDFTLKIIFGRYKYDKNRIFDTIKILTYKTYFDKSLKDQFGFTYLSGYAKGIFSAFFMRSAGLLNEEDNYYNYNQNAPSLHDPFLQERLIIKTLAKAKFLSNKITEKRLKL